MSDYLVLGIALLITGVAVVGGVIYYETGWKARRQRRIARDHARNKTRRPLR